MEFFILIFLVLFALLAGLRPAWAIAFILATLPAYQIRFVAYGIPTTLLEWMILILAAATLVKTSIHYRAYSARIARFFQNFPFLCWASGLFVFSALVGTAVSPDFLKALGIFKAFFAEGGAFFLLCIIHLDSEKKFFLALKTPGFLVFVLAVFGVYQFFTLERLPPVWWGPGLEPRRVVSLYTYPNAVSLLLAPILALYTALLIFRDQLKTYFSTSFLATIVVSGLILLTLTFSRGAWIGYIVAVAFLLLFTRHKKTILAALVIGVFSLLLVPASRARLLPVFAGADPAGQERFKLMRGAFELIRTNPLFGGGLAGFRSWYGALKQANADEILNYPHNFFLNFWVETGLLGLATVVGMLISTAAKARALYQRHLESRRLVVAALAAWVALLVHGQFDAPFFKNDLAILFWFLLAIIPIIEMFESQKA